MVKNCALIIVLLLLSSCCKAIFENETFLNNTTNNKIELQLYYNGISTLNVVEAKSKSTAYFRLPYSVPVDSIMLYINGVHMQTQYNTTINKVSVNAKVVQFKDPRNLLNIDNYQIVRKSLACNGSLTTYTYSF